MNKKTVHIFCRQLIVEYFLLIQAGKMKKQIAKMLSLKSLYSQTRIPNLDTLSLTNPILSQPRL